MHVLLVKMSSLGDVVHALPAVSDAEAAGVHFDWVVEEAFAGIPARHPAVETVLPIAWRRWRSDLWNNRTALREFAKNVRARSYDLVLDSQGLFKSAAVLALARGRRKAGYARGSAREGGATWFYGQRYVVERGQHAIDRQRQLFAAALGYPLPGAGNLQFRLGSAVQAERTCVLLHGTTWASKHWPEVMWAEVARLASQAGFQVLLPWGNPEEHARAQRIAAAGAGEVLERLSLEALSVRLEAAAMVIGVDSGLAHLAAALGVPTVVIYGSTDSALTGCRGPAVAVLQADFTCAPCLRRECAYQGPAERWHGSAVEPACYARVDPDTVWTLALETADADRILSV